MATTSELLRLSRRVSVPAIFVAGSLFKQAIAK